MLPFLVDYLQLISVKQLCFAMLHQDRLMLTLPFLID
jgi:hypothetical protein